MGNGTQKKNPGALRRHWPLGVIVLAFFVLVLIYSWTTPPYEGPDEAQHYAYITWLAEGNGFPPQGDEAWKTEIKQESGQPPLYYLLASLAVRTIDFENPPATYRPNPHFVGPSPHAVFDNDNNAIHYLSDEQPLRGGWLALRAARLVTIGFGIILIIGVYALAWQLKPEQPAPALAVAVLVAFTPQVLYISAVASNDIPAAAMSTLSLVFLVTVMQRSPARCRGMAFASGVFAGLAALAKVNTLILGVPIAVALLWLWLGKGEALRHVVVKALFIAAGMTLTAGWWFVRVARLYGSPLGIATHNDAPWAMEQGDKLVAGWARWVEVFRYYWIALGWGTIRPEGWVYAILFGFVALAVIGLFVAAWHYWRQRRPSFADQNVAFALVFSVLILANVVFLEVWMRRVIAPYGRLLFPSIGAITISLFIGWQALHRRLALLPISFVMLLGILTPFIIIGPAYTADYLSEEEIADLPSPIGWRFGDTIEEPIAELISVTPNTMSTENQSIFIVEVCWRILAQAEDDYTVLLQIIGPDDMLVGQRRSYPGQGLLPTTQWEPGGVICDPMHFRLKAPWAKTLVYRVEIHVLDEDTDRRLKVVDPQSEQVESTFIKPIRVFDPSDAATIVSDFPNNDAVQLLNYSVNGPVFRRGEAIEVTFEWAAKSDLETDYQVFLHLREAGSSELVAQADGPPLDGWYPTSWWPVGEIVRDSRTIDITEDIPPGEYDLFSGFYDLNTLERPGEEQYLGRLQIEP